jgi:hypothetical protein
LSLANLAVSVARDKLLSLGVSVGKFTKSGKFKVAITFLPILAEVSVLFCSELLIHCDWPDGVYSACEIQSLDKAERRK